MHLAYSQIQKQNFTRIFYLEKTRTLYIIYVIKLLLIFFFKKLLRGKNVKKNYKNRVQS